jgi:hypothetical protein
MSDEKTITAKEAHVNPLLAMPVTRDTELKNYLVEYVGKKLNPEDEEVTVNMVAEVLAADFPEFIFAFAEENFMRGYELGLNDAEKLYSDETSPIT